MKQSVNMNDWLNEKKYLFHRSFQVIALFHTFYNTALPIILLHKSDHNI